MLDALEVCETDAYKVYTSASHRHDPDTCDSPEITATQQATMQMSGIDKDVADFISGRFDAG